MASARHANYRAAAREGFTEREWHTEKGSDRARHTHVRGSHTETLVRERERERERSKKRNARRGRECSFGRFFASLASARTLGLTAIERNRSRTRLSLSSFCSLPLYLHLFSAARTCVLDVVDPSRERVYLINRTVKSRLKWANAREIGSMVSRSAAVALGCFVFYPFLCSRVARDFVSLRNFI